MPITEQSWSEKNEGMLELLRVLKKNYNVLVSYLCFCVFSPSIKYTYTISDNTVTFIDLQLTTDNNA